MQTTETMPVLYDHMGRALAVTKSTIPNPSPTFFFGSRSNGNLTSQEIEKNPYKYQWIIYACARAISSQVARIPNIFRSIATQEKVESPQLAKLFAKPNHLMTGKTFMQAVSLCLDLQGKDSPGGQCFIVCNSGKEDPKVDLARGDIPAAMYPYNSDYVTVWENTNANGRKVFKGWTWQIPGIPESRIDYEPHQIIRIYNYNPYNWYEGIAAYQAAKLAVMQDIKSDVWNSQMYDNDAVPSGILSADGYLNEEQMDMYRKGWYERNGGPGNARRVAVLGAGLKFQAIANTAKDMEFSSQKESVRDEIIAVFGLNKIALGNYEQINMATIVEGRRMLMEDVYLPRHQHITEALNSQWVNNINPSTPIEIVEDVSGIPVLKKDIKPQADALKVFVDARFPVALAARLTDVQLTEQDLKDYPWLNEEPKVPTPYSGPANAPTAPEKSAPAIVVRLTKDERDKISADYIERVLDPGERSFKRKINDLFLSQRNKMQDKVDAWLRKELSNKAEHTANVSPYMFNIDLTQENIAIVNMYRPQLVTQLKTDRAKLKEELGDLVEWKVTDPMIDSMVDARRQVLYGINGTTFDSVKDNLVDIIAEGETNNWTIQEYAKKIKEEIGNVIEERRGNATTIARTETGSISSTARFDAFKTEGVEYHQWLSSQDERVRTAHAMVDGTIVRVGDVFPYVGVHYPLESTGDLGQIINCRCVTIYAEGPV